MKLNIFIILLLAFSFSSCNLFEEEEEEEGNIVLPDDFVFSDIDGEEYKKAIDMGGARAVSSLVLLGYVEEVQPDMISMVADSIPTEDSLWRNRHYMAISAYNEMYDDIPTGFHYKFGIAIFHMLMYHPNEVIAHFDSATVLELDFWSDRLKEEIRYKMEVDSIPLANMIAMSQDHCEACDSVQLGTIKKMVETLYEDI